MESRSLSSQRRYLHDFQTLSFICNQFGTKFGCDWFRIMPSKVLSTAICSGCAVQKESEQTPFSRTGCLTVDYLDFMFCAGFDLEHAESLLCHIFTQRLMNARKIEWSNGFFGLKQCKTNLKLWADSAACLWTALASGCWKHYISELETFSLWVRDWQWVEDSMKSAFRKRQSSQCCRGSVHGGQAGSGIWHQHLQLPSFAGVFFLIWLVCSHRWISSQSCWLVCSHVI